MDVKNCFECFCEDGIDDLPAAILTLAAAVNRCSPITACEELSHAICMGIRFGLMGVNASNGADLRDLNVNATVTNE